MEDGSRSDPGRAVHDSTSFPIFVVSRAGRILDANRAACSYFGQTLEQLRGTDALGMRGYSPSRRAAFSSRFDAWTSGGAVPFVSAWPPRTGADQFVVIVHGAVPQMPQPAVALALIPLELVKAAIAGDSERSGQLATEWAAQHSSDTVTPASDALLATLTPREWEIARRLAEGDRVPLIVEDLRIAENTVRNHLKSIFRKLEVASQAQLVRRIKPQLKGAGRST